MLTEAATAAGWTANALFFARFLHQWLASERAGRCVTPAVFWRLSLAGSLLLACYLVAAGEPVLLLGLAVNAAVYARNLWAARRPGFRGLAPAPLAALAAGALALVVASGLAGSGGRFGSSMGWNDSLGWLVVSILGQGLWSARFVLQWSATERRGRSHFPTSFWWTSLAGNALLFAYATHRRDPILIAGLLPGPITQVRNLALARRAAAREPDGDRPPGRTIPAR